ncbi:MAG: SPOR domain-containing protein [Bacteroidota bacterium]
MELLLIIIIIFLIALIAISAELIKLMGRNFYRPIGGWGHPPPYSLPVVHPSPPGPAPIVANQENNRPLLFLLLVAFIVFGTLFVIKQEGYEIIAWNNLLNEYPPSQTNPSMDDGALPSFPIEPNVLSGTMAIRNKLDPDTIKANPTSRSQTFATPGSLPPHFFCFQLAAYRDLKTAQDYLDILQSAHPEAFMVRSLGSPTWYRIIISASPLRRDVEVWRSHFPDLNGFIAEYLAG